MNPTAVAFAFRLIQIDEYVGRLQRRLDHLARYKLHFSVNSLFHPLIVGVFIRSITESVALAFRFIQTLIAWREEEQWLFTVELRALPIH